MPVEILRDSTTRADGAIGSPDFGGPYVVNASSGTATIVSNKLRLTATGGGGRVSVTHDTGNSNHGIFVKFQGHNGGSFGHNSRLAVRAQIIGGYLGGIIWELYNNVVGVSSNGTGISTSLITSLPSVSVGDEVGLVTTGNYILAMINGRCVGTAQTTSFLGTTVCGINEWDQGGGGGTTVDVTNVRIDKRQSSFPNYGIPRLGWDRDGTLAYKGFNGGLASATALTTTEKQSLNKTATGGGGVAPTVSTQSFGAPIVLAFPEPRNIYGGFAIMNDANASGAFGYSTQPVGTALSSLSFTGLGGGVHPYSTGWGYQRSGVNLWYATGVTFLQVSYTTWNWGEPTFYAFHVYGVPTTNSNVHRVGFWHPYFDLRLPGDYLDMDDVTRAQTYTREFRIKNTSSVYTMNNIVLDIESLSFGTALTDEYSIKRASEGTYQPNTTVTSLAPGALSEIISVRRIVSGAAPFRLDSPRIRSQIGSLS